MRAFLLASVLQAASSIALARENKELRRLPRRKTALINTLIMIFSHLLAALQCCSADMGSALNTTSTPQALAPLSGIACAAYARAWGSPESSGLKSLANHGPEQ